MLFGHFYMMLLYLLDRQLLKCWTVGVSQPGTEEFEWALAALMQLASKM